MGCDTRSKLLAAALAGLSTGLPVPVLASQFNITVPIRVSNLPAGIDQVRVRCTADGAGAVHGEATEIRSVTRGSFNGGCYPFF